MSNWRYSNDYKRQQNDSYRRFMQEPRMSQNAGWENNTKMPDAPPPPFISNHNNSHQFNDNIPQHLQTLDDEFERARANVRRHSKLPARSPSYERSSVSYSRMEIDSDRDSFDDEELLRVQRRITDVHDNKKQPKDTAKKPYKKPAYKKPTKRRYYAESNEPGGKNDLNCQGLSGCGRSWYLRYLRKGYTTDEAVKAAWQHRKKPYARGQREQYLRGEISPLRLPSPPSGSTSSKRSPHHTNHRSRHKSPVHARHKSPVRSRHKSPVRARNNDTASKSDRITIVLTAKDPTITLLSTELTHLAEALQAEFTAINDLKPKFHGIYYKANKLHLECDTEETVEWLKMVVPQLKAWQGPELQILFKNKFDKFMQVTLPRSAGEDSQSLLSIIEAQNDGISTSSWEVCVERDTGRDKYIELKIDYASWCAIRDLENCLYFRFGKVNMLTIPKERLSELERNYGHKRIA